MTISLILKKVDRHQCKVYLMLDTSSFREYNGIEIQQICFMGGGSMNLFYLFSMMTMFTAQAKDLDSRVGVGVNNWFASQAAVSFRYALPVSVPEQETQVEAVVGFSTDPSSPSALTVGGRVLYAVVVEDNLNVFAGGGAGFLMLNGTGALRLQLIMVFSIFYGAG